MKRRSTLVLLTTFLTGVLFLSSCNVSKSKKTSSSTSGDDNTNTNTSDDSGNTGGGSTYLSTFINARFDDKTFPYDGQVHSISVTGVPNGTTINYENNNQSAAGKYLVRATLSKEGYQTATLSAYLKIFYEFPSTMKMDSKSFVYDGSTKSLVVENAPEGADISYSGNNKTNVGTYTVKATVKKDLYIDKTLTATLTITENTNYWPDFVLPDATFIAKNSEWTYELEKNELPSNTKASYVWKQNGVAVSSHKNAGTYQIVCTLTDTLNSAHQQDFVATVKILDPNIGGTDASLNQFKFDSNVKFDDLINNLSKGNYHVYLNEYSARYTTGTTNLIGKESGAFIDTYFTNDGMFQRYSEHDANDKITSWEYYNFAYNVGADAYFKDLSYFPSMNDGFRFSQIDYVKMPKKAILQNQILDGSTVMSAFEEIEKSSNGGLQLKENSQTKIVSISNNSIKIETRSVRSYPSDGWDRHEVVEYTISNIGNTKIDFYQEMKPTSDEQNTAKPGSFALNGITYKHNSSGYYEATLEINRRRSLETAPGTYEVLPHYGGDPVKKFVVKVNNGVPDLTGYIYNLWFEYDSDSRSYVYRGDYANQPALTSVDTTGISQFTSSNGVIHDYSAWHE